MRYVTIQMLCEHTGKHRSSIKRAMQQAGIKGEKFPGVLGIRIAERDANKMLSRHWPECGPLPVQALPVNQTI